MESYFTQEFKTYYETCDDFAKELINWCSISNLECSKGFCNLFLDTVNDNEKNMVISNFENRDTEQILKPFDNQTKLNLIRYFDTLDGTLLVDLVYRELRTHKIFN